LQSCALHACASRQTWGALIRSSSSVENLDIASALTFGLGVTIPVMGDELDVHGELYGVTEFLRSVLARANISRSPCRSEMARRSELGHWVSPAGPVSRAVTERRTFALCSRLVS
jgi:hypothetical protein